MHWLYPANLKFYDVLGAFREPETYWPVSSGVEPGNRVFIYLTAPLKRIGFVFDVSDVGIAEVAIVEKVHPFVKGKIDGKIPRNRS